MSNNESLRAHLEQMYEDAIEQEGSCRRQLEYMQTKRAILANDAETHRKIKEQLYEALKLMGEQELQHEMQVMDAASGYVEPEPARPTEVPSWPPCEACKGVGWIWPSKDSDGCICSDCNGLGHVRPKESRAERNRLGCSDCSGSGHAWGYVCQTCGGGGAPEDVEEPSCQNCDGYGHINGYDCQLCGGSGDPPEDEDPAYCAGCGACVNPDHKGVCVPCSCPKPEHVDRGPAASGVSSYNFLEDDTCDCRSCKPR